MARKDDIRETVIRGGVNSLGRFGYPKVRPENILTDPIYSAFFKSMLEDTAREIEGKDAVVEAVVRDLIAECAGLDAPAHPHGGTDGR